MTRLEHLNRIISTTWGLAALRAAGYGSMPVNTDFWSAGAVDRALVAVLGTLRQEHARLTRIFGADDADVLQVAAVIRDVEATVDDDTEVAS